MHYTFQSIKHLLVKNVLAIFGGSGRVEGGGSVRGPSLIGKIERPNHFLERCGVTSGFILKTLRMTAIEKLTQQAKYNQHSASDSISSTENE